ncbi:chromosome segregation protein SMC [Ruminococcus sp.]|uniref:chromosome segregation protein SMC n=1 Tax=Ruminococcus sp. TaxID=41978 RepID=UPI0025D243AF|nr:chromosome segregation protein SMC [Ruminococcus sp.]MBQ8965130.1 chromosome segregation protein SMC [Ruminococcus sp.]
MYLRGLELQGFKSFPDKTVLTFGKGITAVVGPNGSGKSNISDAMRWVMGEQSSKALRGEKMAGVIFHGCATRKESPFAQVTLTIDNEDGALGIDSEIVSVSRKLYKNGDSEYLINGSPVRLKDVNELFMDTGLGKDGYSIVGQGRIADIVNGKGSDRREIFEEAAGVAKFRYKKSEAERRLVEAEDNIERLTDILSELEGRIGPLEKQCEKAKKFKVLDDEKTALEISVWVTRLEEYRQKLADTEERIKLLNEQYSALSEELAESEDKIESDLRESAQCASNADDISEKIHEAELAGRSGEAEIAVCENDIAHIEENINRLKEQIENSRADKYFLESELKQRREELTALNEKQVQDAKAVTDKEQEFNDLLDEADKSDKAVSEVNSAISAAYLEKSRLSFTAESLKNTIQETADRLAEIAEDRQEISKNKDLADKELEKLRKQHTEKQEAKSEKDNVLGGMTRLLEKRREKLGAAVNAFSQAESRLTETVSRLNILKDLERSMEGFGYSVKHIMNAVKQGRISGVCGTVAQLVGVESSYSVAVETALGGALQNIVVENEDSAKRGIRLLKESKAGRATFLPITSVKGQRLDDRSLENEEGFVALGCDIVTYDKKYEGIVRSLLGRICIAEDIDSASRIARAHGYKFRIVTLDGQVVNAGGSYTGGSVSKSTGILTRKNEINDLEAKKQKLEADKAQAGDEKEKLRNEANKLAADIEGVKENLNQLGGDILRLELEIKRVTELSAGYEKSLEDSGEEEKKLREKAVQADKELDKTLKDTAEVDKRIFEKEAELNDSRGEQERLKTRRSEISTELSELRIKGAETAKDIENCKESIASLEKTITERDSDGGRLALDIENEKEKIKGKQADIEFIRQKIKDSGAEAEKLKAELEDQRRKQREFSESAEKLRAAQKNKLDEKENLATQLSRGEERKNSISADFDKLVNKLWDEYELTRTTAAEQAQPVEDMADAEKHLAELRNKIRALGNVNLGAIEEYAEVKERYDFLSAQLTDVNVSKEELCKLIDELTEKMKSVFMQSFEEINRNFGSIFKELFGGGSGELILTDPENVLECGVEINVQPPGKVITSLMSLSGGEQAMAAIAIYFAIFRYSPAPFCLLDEIEAALDDVNVSRYAQYLHRLTDKTQFITITHRRGTMEEADVLYGVTMQEKGISKLLKMNAGQTVMLDEQ